MLLELFAVETGHIVIIVISMALDNQLNQEAP